MEFKDRLKAQRLEWKYTQKEVAEKLGVSIPCYNGYETGYREPDLKMLKKICQLFEVSADYLLDI